MADDQILRLAGRGDGVTADGRHIAGTAPGDIVDDAGGLVAAGPHRVTPPCRHFGACGGCQLQHVDDDAYRAFVIDRIVGALAAQQVAPPAMAAAHLSPPGVRRRATLKAARKDSRVLIGFNQAESHRVVALGECPVMHPALFAMVAPLRALLERLLPQNGAASVSLTLCDQGVDVGIGPVPSNGRAMADLIQFADSHALARLSIDQGYGIEPIHAPQPPTIRFSGIPVPLPPDAFLQATLDGEAALVSAVAEVAGTLKRRLDLFAGLGTFAVPLSAHGPVVAMEGASTAVEALGQGARAAGRPIAVVHRDLFRSPLDAAELAKFDFAVIDPPRAGARAQAGELARSKLARIAMVSCNPSSFARDARALIDGGYRLTRIWPVGQFRWSTHVELVGAFER
jgi:23S rRNA (uracil1939-C5)-methyltransferase